MNFVIDSERRCSICYSRIDEIEEGKTTKVLSNLAVDIDGYIEQFGLTKEDLGIEERFTFLCL